jgi:D-isomer specific 2-hydroxyacid dehydrogenase-like protein
VRDKDLVDDRRVISGILHVLRLSAGIRGPEASPAAFVRVEGLVGAIQLDGHIVAINSSPIPALRPPATWWRFACPHCGRSGTLLYRLDEHVQPWRCRVCAGLKRQRPPLFHCGIDMVFVTVPLTRETFGIIGRRELGLMKEDAILVNLARGELVDEEALYLHLRDHRSFVACIDAWWVEPVRHRRFEMQFPFLDLPNVIASPHNSAAGGNGRTNAIKRAALNCVRALAGERPFAFDLARRASVAHRKT